jgi:DNA-binding MarR family transcriptional regulator
MGNRVNTLHLVSLFIFMKENHNWAAVIPCRYLMSKDINSTQKLLIGLISSLSNLKGYCFASNEYLADCLDISKITASQLISDLEKKGYLGRIIYRNDKKQVEQRILTLILDKYPSLENITPPIENDNTLPLNSNIPPIENRKDNIKVNSNINIKNNSIIPTFEMVEDYFSEKERPELAESFFDFYTSNGWMVGKNKMKDYKSAIRNWIRNDKKFNKNVTTKSSSDIYAERRAELHQYTDKIDFLRGIRP